MHTSPTKYLLSYLSVNLDVPQRGTKKDSDLADQIIIEDTKIRLVESTPDINIYRQ